MQRTIVIQTNKEAEASVEELYELRKEAFDQWSEQGLRSGAIVPVEQFKWYLSDKTVFETIGDGSLQAECGVAIL